LLTAVVAPAHAAGSALGGQETRLVAASASITITHYPGEPVWPQYGTYIVAGYQPVEIWAKRTPYAGPITAYRVLREHGTVRRMPLPDGLITGLSGLSDFTHVTVTDTTGATIIDEDQDFCPNGTAARARPGCA
jgi:hypothetical protein